MVLRAIRAETFRFDLVNGPAIPDQVFCELSIRLRSLHRVLTCDLKGKFSVRHDLRKCKCFVGTGEHIRFGGNG